MAVNIVATERGLPLNAIEVENEKEDDENECGVDET